MYYLYAHECKLTKEIFYIGKGTFNSNTSYGGYHRAYSKGNRTKEWQEKAKYGYDIHIIEENESEEYILEKEDLLWMDCTECVNKQLNTNFKEYEIIKINEDLAILNIFLQTFLIFSEGYIINKFGERLKGQNNGKGYIIHGFSKGRSIKKNMYEHRLVAEAFIENPNNYKVVNHKDRNRKNNNKTNLEWTTTKGNIEHSIKLGSYAQLDRMKPLLKFNSKGEFQQRYNNVSEVTEEFKCTKELIQQAASQNNIDCHSAKKYLWIYEEDYNKGNRTKFDKIIKQYANKKFRG